ncbi:MAG: 3-deoxy-D-manno-octulosonic acid transferase [Burkholderiales bacterium]|nr:3-deoxy-D-manno-octulosonic acid transferase [Burkholderiales bacterium]
MKAVLARLAYGWLLRLLLPVLYARLWWRGLREPLYRAAWGERLGLYADRVPGPAGRIWIHAVSLGETRAARTLVDALRRQRPGVSLLLTHGTATGREAGRALLQPGDAQLWLPFDTPGSVRRFLRQQRPAVGVLMETEIWPSLLLAARKAGVPMVLANARLSEKSQAKGRRVRALLQPALAALTCTLAQTEADAARLRESGVAPVEVAGNLKFDLEPDAALLERGRQWRQALARPVVLMASSREGEEAPLLAAWAALPAPRPLLLLVPRHPQRFDEVAALAQAALPRVLRRSAFVDAPPPEAAAADVWIGDSIGEMPLYYALADVALLGGSYAPLGGQNLIEAAACGCPVLMGPHTFNFAAAADDAIAAGAARRVADLPAAVALAVELVSTASGLAERAAMAANALSFSRAHRGAAERMASAILALPGTAREAAASGSSSTPD